MTYRTLFYHTLILLYVNPYIGIGLKQIPIEILIQSLRAKSVIRWIRPIRNPLNQSMLDGIGMNIMHMIPIIVPIPNPMFPKLPSDSQLPLFKEVPCRIDFYPAIRRHGSNYIQLSKEHKMIKIPRGQSPPYRL